MLVTDAQFEALLILQAEKGNLWPGMLTPSKFAREMWPDSPSWSRCSKVGRGSSTSVGINQRAGSFLSRLHGKGWVERRRRGRFAYQQTYFISRRGLTVLAVAMVERGLVCRADL